MGDDQGSDQEREELPRPVPEAGLPGGSNSVVGDKVPGAPPGREDVRQDVVGGPQGGSHEEVAPGDQFGSQQGASAAMGDSGDDNSDEDLTKPPDR